MVPNTFVSLFRRYAVYDTGPDRLAAWGAHWLGWDLRAGAELSARGPDGWTSVPRRYGFHATIKAPFRLADGATAEALADALAALVIAAAPVALPRLSLTEIGGVLALTPVPQPPALTDLAGDVVRGLDQFRAPLTAAEMARRDPARLNVVQRANLHRWGYPYVMQEFRYHMTLTGQLSGAEMDHARAALTQELGPLLAEPQPLSTLALVGEDARGRFHLIRSFSLRG